jgi:hypothetical protein
MRTATAYRDEREALRARVHRLEEQLSEARASGRTEGETAARARAEALHGELEGVRGQLDRIDTELGRIRGQPKRPWRVLALIAVFGLGLSGLIRHLALEPAKPPSVEYLAPVLPSPASAPAAEVPKAETRPPAKPAVPAAPVTPEVPHLRTAEPRWAAKVRRAEGLPLPPGARCSIVARVEARGTNAVVPTLRVECGKHVLFDGADDFNGIAARHNDAQERLGPTDERSTFTLQYSDLGARTGARAQVTLDSMRREVVAFRESSPRYRVELTMNVESEPTAPLSGASERLRRRGRVVEVSGAPRVAAGDQCVVRAMPTGKREACVVEVACGTKVLAPAMTPAQCRYEVARPVSVSAGGPSGLVLEGDRLTVSGERTGTWSVDIALEPTR